MKHERIVGAIESLSMIEDDSTVPRNIRIRIKTTMKTLQEQGDVSIIIDRSLEELSEVADDPNISSYTRMQIWSIVSQLECDEE